MFIYFYPPNTKTVVVFGEIVVSVSEVIFPVCLSVTDLSSLSLW